MENRLYRSRTDRMLFGVCGGLGKYLGFDSTIIRIIFGVLVFCGGIGIVAYIVMAIVVPIEESKKSTPQGIVEENVAEIKETATKLGSEIRDTFSGKGQQSGEEVATVQARRRNILGIVIIGVGVICLLGTLNILHWNWWGGSAAVVLIVIGVLLIVGIRRSK
jgi:phage shock protein PspC (stress-responsive transcriptional regulator)